MQNPVGKTVSADQELVGNFVPYLSLALTKWIRGDRKRIHFLERILELLQRPSSGRLKITLTDLFLDGHLSEEDLETQAEDRASESETVPPHLDECSLCDALVDVAARRIINERTLEVDHSGLQHKTPQAATDNDKWF